MHFDRSGQSLVEILLAVALMAVLLPALGVGLIATREGKPQEQQRLQATQLLTQTQEALRSIREKSWASFAVDGTYAPQLNGSSWSLATGAATVNGFTQSVMISDVYRNTNGTIMTSGGTLDPSTKLVTTTIAWTQPYASQVTATEYFTRYLGAQSWVQTTQADFNTGTTSGTVVVPTTGTSITNDGEVTLSAGSGGDWCAPAVTQYSYSFPGGVPDMIFATPGNAFVATNGNSAGDTFGHISVTYPASGAPTISYVGIRKPGIKTNAIAVDSKYGYLATTKGLVIVNLDSTLSDVGNTDPVGTNYNATAIAVVGTTGYYAVGSTFYTLNFANIAAPTILGQTSLSGNAKRIVIVGSTAYVVTDSTTNQLQMVNVLNPSAPAVAQSVSVGNGQPGVGVAVNSTGTRAYIVTSYSSGVNDFFIVNTSNGAIMGAYSTTGLNPGNVAATTNNKVIIVGSGTQTYLVLNVANESSPVSCGSLSTSYSFYDVSTLTESNGNVYSYSITNDTNQFKIIQGGNGGSGYATSGTFTSQPFTSGFSTAFYSFLAHIAQPSQTSVQLQVGMAPQNNGSCSNTTYTFVGPNGVANAYFTPQGSTISGTIPFGTYGAYQNPNPCYKYKAFFSTNDTTQTPILYDVSTTYAP